jgi:hypothetical protein
MTEKEIGMIRFYYHPTPTPAKISLKFPLCRSMKQIQCSCQTD